MTQTLPARQLFTLRLADNLLHGTFHVPPSGPSERSSTGILILSGFPMPRSAHGDAAVGWATGFAAHGYPAFRIDLPGLGDSFGDVPAELLPFTVTGGYERIAAEVIREITGRYQLSGLVVLGHCSGAVSAIFAVAAAVKACQGLVILDPPFFLPPQRNPRATRALYFWATRSTAGSLLIRLNDRLRQLRALVKSSAALPANANLPMLARWKKLVESGLPILVLTAPEPGGAGPNPRVGKFNYLAHALKMAARKGSVEARVVDGANHSFSNGLGKEAVPANVLEWMSSRFPSKVAEDALSAAE